MFMAEINSFFVFSGRDLRYTSETIIERSVMRLRYAIISAFAALPIMVAAQNPKPNKAAQTASAKAPDMSKVTSGTYSVEKTHALVQWRVSHFGFNDYFGIMGNPTGTLVLDKANPAKSKVTIDIPMDELYTASAQLTEHMKGKDFFNLEAHKTAKFVSTSISGVKGANASITGNLTMLGVTKPVVLYTKFSGSGINQFNQKETIGFHAKASIKRSDWGMGFGVPAVGDQVDLDISVAFEK
jgi:polyisoprenoid-binding protein YceI